MPFALLFIGLLLIIVGFQNTYAAFGQQVVKDFTGSGNFIYWIAAITAVGAIGYSKDLQPLSRVFISLIILSIFLSNKGFFSQFNSALSNGTSQSDNVIGEPLVGSTTSGGNSSAGSGSNTSSGLGNLGTDISLAATAASFF